MIKFQQTQVLPSHFESLWSIVHSYFPIFQFCSNLGLSISNLSIFLVFKIGQIAIFVTLRGKIIDNFEECLELGHCILFFIESFMKEL